MEKRYKKIKINEWRTKVIYEVEYLENDLVEKSKDKNWKYYDSSIMGKRITFESDKFIPFRLQDNWWWDYSTKDYVNKISKKQLEEANNWIEYHKDKISVLAINRKVIPYKHKEVLYEEVKENNDN